MQYLVFKPKALIYQLWKDCVEEALGTSRKAVLFLSLHPIFYSSDTREYYSPVEIDHFRKTLAKAGHQVGMVVSLIDDIYDVFRRLRAPDQLLSVVEHKEQEQTTIEAVLELLMLLDWRSQETMRAEQIARSLGVPHYVVATKHPIKVVYDLVFSNKTPVYVSHPISAVRNLQKLGRTREASRIMAEINCLIRRLVKSKKLVPFFPTTIDEYRIAEKDGNFIPQLTDRWPFGRRNSLLYCPGPNEPRNPLDPIGWFNSGTGKTHPDKAKMLHELLRALRGRIGMQVGSRDKKLVEQSEGLVVFRPYFGGSLSEGVQKEIAHRNTLNEYCPGYGTSRRCVVALPGDDLTAVRNKLIADELQSIAKVNGSGLSDAVLKRIMARVQKDHGVQRMIEKGTLTGPELRRVVEDCSGRVTFTGMPTSLGPLSGELKAVQRTWMAEQWAQLAQRVNSENPLERDLRPTYDLVLQSNNIEELVRCGETILPPKG